MAVNNDDNLNINIKLFNGFIDLTFLETRDYNNFKQKLDQLPSIKYIQ